MPTKAEEAAEQVIRGINELKVQGEASASAIADITLRMQRLEQEQAAANREALDRSHSGGTDVELQRYTRCTESDVKRGDLVEAGVHLVSRDHGPIRLIGHHTRINPNNDESKVWRWGLFDDPTPRTDWQREAQRILTRRNTVAAVSRIIGGSRASIAATWQCDAELMDHLLSGPPEIRRIFADSAGIGSDWIPDRPMPELERDVLVRPAFHQVFPQGTLPQGPVVLPYKTGYLRPYKHEIPTGDDPPGATLSSITPDNRTIVPEHIVVAAQLDRDALEDAIIAVEPEIRQDLVDAIVYAINDAITNGHAVAPGAHQDLIGSWDPRGRLNGTAGLGTSRDHRLLWDGLRRRARANTNTTDQALEATAAGARVALNKLKIEHLINSDGQVRVVISVSPEYFFGVMLGFADFDAFDNVGSLASVVTGILGDTSRTPGGLLPGQVGFLYGRFPVVLNYCQTADLAATGLYTGAGATTNMLCFDRTRMQLRTRRGQMVELMEDPRNNTRTLIARMRTVFRFLDEAGSGAQPVHESYNLPKTA